MDERTDAELIRAYAGGDEGAFEQLVLRYSGPVYRFAFRLVRNGRDAEDVAQETFVKVWRNLNRFDETKSFKAWIFAIAKNSAIDLVRKKEPLVFAELEHDGPEEGDHFAYDVEDERPLPDEVVARMQDAEALDRALAELPPTARAVILMHDGEGLTFQEIADAVREPMNTVKSRYRRGIERLKQRFSGKADIAE
jgi:RNA polymerase sigma-70 factor, ECF subfamily